MRRVTAILCATAACACAPAPYAQRLPCGIPSAAIGASEKQLLLLRPSARCDLGACYEEIDCRDTAFDKVAYTVEAQLFLWDRVTAVSFGRVWNRPYSPEEVAAETVRTTRHLLSLWGPPNRTGLLKKGDQKPSEVVLMWENAATVTSATFSTELSIGRAQYEVRILPRGSREVNGMITGTPEDAVRAAGSLAVW